VTQPQGSFAPGGVLREEMAAVFVAHQRNGISPCMCGLMRYGQSYAYHLVDALGPVIGRALTSAHDEGHAEGMDS
jgi:hypothetical protein